MYTNTTTTTPKPARKRKMPSMARIMAAAERMDGTGFCKACGAEHKEIEPDARNYKCDRCGAERVCGAEEWFI